MRCPDCPRTHPVIGPDGPSSSNILFVGERPGKEENSRGRPFIGQTGRECNEHYLPIAGLSRDNVRFTNSVKCYSVDDVGKDAFKKRLKSCSSFHLAREIEYQKPELIVPMGAVATSIIGCDLGMDHGTPINADWFGTTIKTFPMYHPASGLHDASAMIPLRNDFIALGQFLRGELVMPFDEYLGMEDYGEILTEKALTSELEKIDKFDALATDTETVSLTGPMFCLTFSNRPGFARLVYAKDTRLVSRFADWIKNYHRGPVVFHNGMFDVPVLSRVGVTIPFRRYDDTMVRSYHLQYLPQALKVLAWRLCGMGMKEFEDVVLPHSLEVIISYILKLTDIDWPMPEPQLIAENDGSFKLYSPQGLNTKLKRMLTDYAKKPEMDVLKRWYDWSMEERRPAIELFGPMPEPSIIHVPEDEVVNYACRDADATVRVRKELIRLKRGVRHAN